MERTDCRRDAEWEYACRLGSTTLFCFGDDESFLLGDYAWDYPQSRWKDTSRGPKMSECLGLVRYAWQRVGVSLIGIIGSTTRLVGDVLRGVAVVVVCQVVQPLEARAAPPFVVPAEAPAVPPLSRCGLPRRRSSVGRVIRPGPGPRVVGIGREMERRSGARSHVGRARDGPSDVPTERLSGLADAQLRCAG